MEVSVTEPFDMRAFAYSEMVFIANCQPPYNSVYGRVLRNSAGDDIGCGIVQDLKHSVRAAGRQAVTWTTKKNKLKNKNKDGCGKTYVARRMTQ